MTLQDLTSFDYFCFRHLQTHKYLLSKQKYEKEIGDLSF